MVILSWTDVTGMVELLARTLRRSPFDMVIGVSRSGLIPAVMLSHVLNVREFGAVDIRRTESDAVRAIKRPPLVTGHGMNVDNLQSRRVLLVDDIVGEGATLKAAVSFLKERGAGVVSAALVVNRANCAEEPETIVDRFACTVHDWVVFPWEGKHVDVGAED